jgi:hypothetical protein
VLIVNQETGQISCIRDQWRKAGGSRLMSLFRSGLGNPSAEAARQQQRVRSVLAAEGFENVPTSAVIVFTSPQAQLRVEGCSATVTRLKELRDVLRRMAGKGQNVALTSARVREVQAVFDRRMQAAHSWR